MQFSNSRGGYAPYLGSVTPNAFGLRVDDNKRSIFEAGLKSGSHFDLHDGTKD